MPSVMMRISPQTRATLRTLAAQTGEPMQTLLDKAIEAYRRQRFLEEVNAAYASLRQDPEVWAAVEEERAEWDSTLTDGLDASESTSAKGTEQGKNGRKKSSRSSRSR